MCVDPISLSVLGATALSGLGSAGAAVGTALGGLTTAQAVIGGASVIGAVGAGMQASSEAATDEANAAAARTAGYQQESLKRDDARRAMATQVAALASRGVALDSGAPLALMQDSARNSELDALSVRATANNTGDQYQYKADSVRAAMPFSIAGQLLGGASKLAQLGQI